MDKLLEIKNLRHSYNSNSEVLKGIDIDVSKGEIISILGPSGCGKTTLLRIIAGLEKQTEGTVSIGNQMVADHLHYVPTEQRNVGLVVQERALFPHLTNLKNVKFGIKGNDKEKTSIAFDFLKLSHDCLSFNKPICWHADRNFIFEDFLPIDDSS